jgi:hypothetical protein
LEGLGVDWEEEILLWIFKKGDVRVWTKWKSSGGLLWTRQ